MKLTSLLALVVSVVAPLVSAQKYGYTVIQNKCNFTVYVQSYPYAGGNGPLVTLPALTGLYAAKFVTGGTTLKMDRLKTLPTPLFFGSSLTSNPNYVYYELSSQYGNPFAAYPNALSAGAGCNMFECAANNAACYSTPSSKKVLSCPRPVNVTATLCALSS